MRKMRIKRESVSLKSALKALEAAGCPLEEL